MNYFQLAMLALQAAAAGMDAAAKAKLVYEMFREQADRTSELTPEQSVALDDYAQRIFASIASQPSGR